MSVASAGADGAARREVSVRTAAQTPVRRGGKDRLPAATSVAFSADEAAGDAAGEVVFQAVTAPYDPGSRIEMAFEMASQAEY